MREILFRGKRVQDDKNWVFGSLIQGKDGCSIWSEELKDDVEVDPNTVGQYTGLTDKNGVKIFDGDILKSDDELFVVKYGHCGGVKNVDHEVGYVGFYVNPCGERTERLLIRTDILYWVNEYGVEVIGNIHYGMNPEVDYANCHT